ncbi:hypothetical protein [Streptomyces sp. 351MFTsu5.1]|uniref:hypothetical protein n=1 Tax=Streptomyces sp. 351MFTsu5.1 TaxID=1172180 RepID=UPI001F195363|nr:hypothetical protein [Streptomyces sp. 351MFTsu5.1]
MRNGQGELRLGPRGALWALAPAVLAVSAFGAPAADAAVRSGGPAVAGLERQDQLFVARDGTRRHRADRTVFDRLDRAGLSGGSGGGHAGGGRRDEGAGRHDVWWAVPGLAVGFAAGAGGTRLIRRAAARPGAGPPREEP